MTHCSASLLFATVVLCVLQSRIVTAQYAPTCQGLDDMISRASESLACTRNDLCNTAVCPVSESLFNSYTLTLTLLSCRDPPGVRVVLTNSGSTVTVFDQVIDHTTDISVTSGVTADIRLEQLESQSAVGIEITFMVSTIFGPIGHTLLPYSVLPLDTPSCSPTEAPTTDSTQDTTATDPTQDTTATDPTQDTTATDPTQDTTATDSATDGPYGPTCGGFDDLIDNVENMVCTRNEACDTANCNITQAQFSSYRLSLTLLSCRDPRPGVRVVVRDGDNPGQLVLDRVVDESVSGIDLGSGATLDVTLDQMEDSLGLAASVRVDLGFTVVPVPLLDYTVLPLDRRSCPATEATDTPTTEDTTDTPTTQDTTDTPTTQDTTDTDMTPESSKSTCDVLANLAKDAEFFECTADSKEPCDRVFCSRAIGETEYTAVIVLQPCDDPTSIRIVLSQADMVLVNQTIDHSQEITIPQLFGLTLNFTVDHFDNAIGLQTDGSLLGKSFPVIKYTIIPLDKSNCGAVKSDESSSVGVAETTASVFSLALSLFLSCLLTATLMMV